MSSAQQHPVWEDLPHMVYEPSSPSDAGNNGDAEPHAPIEPGNVGHVEADGRFDKLSSLAQGMAHLLWLTLCQILYKAWAWICSQTMSILGRYIVTPSMLLLLGTLVVCHAWPLVCRALFELVALVYSNMAKLVRAMLQALFWSVISQSAIPSWQSSSSHLSPTLSSSSTIVSSTATTSTALPEWLRNLPPFLPMPPNKALSHAVTQAGLFPGMLFESSLRVGENTPWADAVFALLGDEGDSMNAEYDHLGNCLEDQSYFRKKLANDLTHINMTLTYRIDQWQVQDEREADEDRRHSAKLEAMGWFQRKLKSFFTQRDRKRANDRSKRDRDRQVVLLDLAQGSIAPVIAQSCEGILRYYECVAGKAGTFSTAGREIYNSAHDLSAVHGKGQREEARTAEESIQVWAGVLRGTATTIMAERERALDRRNVLRAKASLLNAVVGVLRKALGASDQDNLVGCSFEEFERVVPPQPNAFAVVMETQELSGMEIDLAFELQELLKKWPETVA